MIWRLKKICRALQKLRKMPLSQLHSYSWGPGDHAHICLAARLLEPDDFAAVCPWEVSLLEHDDHCEECPYFAIVSFYETDEKSMELYMPNLKKMYPFL